MAERIWSASVPARSSASSSSRSVSSLMIAVNVWNVSHTKHSLTSLTASTERLQQSHVCSCVIGLPSLRHTPIRKPFFPNHSSRCGQDAIRCALAAHARPRRVARRARLRRGNVYEYVLAALVRFEDPSICTVEGPGASSMEWVAATPPLTLYAAG